MPALQMSRPVRTGRVFSRTWQHADLSHGVLVVDDDEMVRTFLGVHLREQGRPRWLASDGQEAVEIYQDHGSEIDVVLLDVRMPDMDGPQTLMRLRELNPSVACYFMSADWYPYSAEELMAMGAIGLVTKPATGELLVEVVEEWLANT